MRIGWATPGKKHSKMAEANSLPTCICHQTRRQEAWLPQSGCAENMPPSHFPRVTVVAPTVWEWQNGCFWEVANVMDEPDPALLWLLQVKIVMAIYHWMGRNVDIPNSGYFDVWNLHVYLTNESSFYFCSLFFFNRLNSTLNANWSVNPEGIKISRCSFCFCFPHHLPQSLVGDSIFLLKSKGAHYPKG